MLGKINILTNNKIKLHLLIEIFCSKNEIISKKNVKA